MLAVVYQELPVRQGAADPGSASFLASPEDEQAVIVRLQRGDRAAFSVLYGWYGDRLYRSVLVRLPDPTLAEDVVRDTFRTALERIDSFQWTGRSIWFWLHRIGVNKAMDVHRRARRDRTLSDRLLLEPVLAEVPAPDRGIEVDQTAAEVQASLGQLNPRYAEVLRLRLLEDRPREECASLLGVTLGNLDVLLHRAAKAFRKVFPP